MEDLDETVVQNIKNFHSSIEAIEEILPFILDKEKIQSLPQNEKLSVDIFSAYMLNTLYWLYLRTQGIDPLTNNVKQELERVKKYMSIAKSIKDRELRPKVNVPVAGRFIKHNVPSKRKTTEEYSNKNAKRKR